MTPSTRARSCQAAHCAHGDRPPRGALGPAGLLVAGMTAFGVVLAVFSGSANPAQAADAAAQQPSAPRRADAFGSLFSPGIVPGSLGSRSLGSSSLGSSSRGSTTGPVPHPGPLAVHGLTPTHTALAALTVEQPPAVATPSAVAQRATGPAATTRPPGAGQRATAQA